MIKISIAALFLCLGTASSAFAATPLTDAQISKVLVTMNEGQIDAGKIAKSKSTTGAVKDFAKMMIDDHQKNMSDTKKIGKENKISMDKSDLSNKLQSDAKAANMTLKKHDKANIDQAYMDQEIMMHEQALATIKDELLTNAKNSRLIEHLQNTQAAVETHLKHAREIRAKL